MAILFSLFNSVTGERMEGETYGQTYLYIGGQ